CICRPLGAARTKKPRPRGGVLLAVADSAWHLVCGTRRGVSSQRRRSSFILRGSPATFRSNGGKGTAAATIPQQDAGGDGNSVEARLRRNGEHDDGLVGLEVLAGEDDQNLERDPRSRSRSRSNAAWTTPIPPAPIPRSIR